jgi:hypothetical protein
MDGNLLGCYDNVERMEEERVITRLYRAEVVGCRGRRRPKLNCIDSIETGIDRKLIFFNNQEFMCLLGIDGGG